MSKIDQIIQAGRDSTALLFRHSPYGRNDERAFLRDVIAMANADMEGTRLIVLGVETATDGPNTVLGLPQAAAADGRAYQDLAREFIEPPIRLRYMEHRVDGQRVGLLQISGCHDRPYMMRIDHSDALRRGDAWIRTATGNARMGRTQFESIFAAKMKKPDRARALEVGFRGEYVRKELSVPVHDLANLPSAAHQARLRQMLEVEKQVADSGGTTRIVRLTHARLFGANSEYVNADCAEIEREIAAAPEKYWREDQRHMFVDEGFDLEFVIFNHGDEPIREASLALVMPDLPGLFVARSLPNATGADQDAYPSVGMRQDGAVFISDNIGDLPAGEMSPAFRKNPRIFASNELAGTKIAVRYELSARDLGTPCRGRLKLIFPARRKRK